MPGGPSRKAMPEMREATPGTGIALVVPPGVAWTQGRALHPDARQRRAYGVIYGSSAERTAPLSGSFAHYNFSRRHGALGHKPPRARMRELTEVLRNYT